MITIKSLIKYSNANCIEVTWVETIKTTQEIEVEKEINGELVKVLEEKDNEVESIIHCQAYADVQVDLLRADAEKYGTSLDDYEYIIQEVVDAIVPPTKEELEAQEFYKKQQDLIIWKAERDIKIQNIEVTYKDVVYQGDEKSQDRMSRAISALPNTEVTTMWVAKDNSIQLLNKEDLQNILLLARTEMSKIWIEGRPDGF